MLDLKLNKYGDLDIAENGDIESTESVCQAVRIRLLWFLGEWRLGSDLGFPYYEQVLVKNPKEVKIKHLLREKIMEVKEVTEVKEIEYKVDEKTRTANIAVLFCTDENTFREEVKIGW